MLSFLKSLKGYLPALKAELISIEKQRVGGGRDIFSSGNGSHERNCPWTSEQQLPIDVLPPFMPFHLER